MATGGQDRFQQQQVQGIPTRKACSVRETHTSVIGRVLEDGTKVREVSDCGRLEQAVSEAQTKCSHD